MRVCSPLGVSTSAREQTNHARKVPRYALLRRSAVRERPLRPETARHRLQQPASVLAGYPPMANPSAAELAAVLGETRTQAADVPIADQRYIAAQQSIAGMRPQADELIEETVEQLRFALRKLDAATQRRIMRSYGATFIPLPGEPPTPKNPPRVRAA